MASGMAFHIGDDEHFIDSPTDTDIEQCILALNNEDRSGITLNFDFDIGFYIITGGANGLVLVRFWGHSYIYILVVPELLDDPREVLLSIQYQSAETPIYTAIPQEMAVKAVLSSRESGWLATDYHWKNARTREVKLGKDFPIDQKQK
jgi:hypothetical protein